MIYVLDACAMIAYLRDEAGADVVEAAMFDPAHKCLAQYVNLCEVFYTFHPDGGDAAATGAMNDISAMSVIERNDADQSFWQDVKSSQILTGKHFVRFVPRVMKML